jgi:addiction module RelE/StbE family toxin
MVQVIWTDNAIQDLNDIGDYIAKDSTRYAEITVLDLFNATDILETHPRSGVKTPEFNNDSIRHLVRGDYKIVYKIMDDSRIDILAVHNCARLVTNTMTFRRQKKK